MVAPAAGDKRFKDRDWQENQVFDFIKQSYLLTANWMQDTVAKVDGNSIPKTQKRIEFYTKQFADAIAPTNFVLTNPEVLRATMQSNGENLGQGPEQSAGGSWTAASGQLSIRQSADAFKIGENIATAPGKVVFRNELIELLQFDPATEEVYETPLLIFPPWINKFYILDLQPGEFLHPLGGGAGLHRVRRVLGQPGQASSRKKTFEDYMREGIFAALDAVEARDRRSQDQLSSAIASAARCCRRTLAYMAATGDDRVNSATFFAAQADFSEAGDLQIFIDDEQLEALQAADG